MRTRSLLSFMVLFLSGAASGQTGTAFTLRQCVETALKNNLQVQQAGMQVQREEINWKQSQLDRLPDLNATVNHGINRGRSIDPFTNTYIDQQLTTGAYGASSGVVLFNGFSLQNAVKQNKLAFDASGMDWQQQKDNITINVILAYLQVLSSEDALAQVRSQAALTKQQVDRLEILNREGAIAPSLLADLKGQYASDQLGIISAENALETAKISLCQWMNIPYDRTMKTERMEESSLAVKYEDTPEKIYQTSLQQFALIKAADLRVASAEKGVKVARGQLFPTLSFGVSANSNYSSAATREVLTGTTLVTSSDYVTVNGTSYNVISPSGTYTSSKIGYGSQLKNTLFTSYGLSLRLPVFNAFRQRNKIKLAVLSLQNTRAVAATARTQLQQQVEQAYSNMTSAAERYKTLLQQAEAYQESFRAAEVRFNNGVGTSTDYLIAKNNLDRTHINIINARYDFMLRTRVLDYYQGKPLW
ncbi:MAG: TolC family protein [Chitinophagaceae bacterium]